MTNGTSTNDPGAPARAIRFITVLAAEGAYAALIISFCIRTWRASGDPPDLPSVQASAAGALAVALGGGYALTLGIPTTKVAERTEGLWDTIKSAFNQRTALVLGVFIYFVAGAAIAVTYAVDSGQTPEVMKTIAVGFGGYVIAYLGTAYRELVP
jgi:hypothetical protein